MSKLQVESRGCILKTMKPKKRQKLCYNCEGEIDLDVIVCPFCAADLREEKPTLRSPMQQMSSSLYPSPYPVREEEPREAALPPRQEAEAPVEAEEKSSGVVGSILLFSIGATLFLLGLLLVLFSHNGSVTLKWDARLWFLYLFASIPFLVFGYRSISKL